MCSLRRLVTTALLVVGIVFATSGSALPASASAAVVEGFIYGPTMDAQHTVGHVDDMTVKWTCATYEPACTWQPFATLTHSPLPNQCSALDPRASTSSTQTGSGTVASGALDFSLPAGADKICLYVLARPGTNNAAYYKLAEARMVPAALPQPSPAAQLLTGQRAGALKKCKKKHEKGSKKRTKCIKQAKKLPE